MESTEYDYKYKYVTSLPFESKYVMIADGTCDKIGIDLFNEIDGTDGDYDENFKAMGPMRIKEPWRCYIKLRKDDEHFEDILDIIFINHINYHLIAFFYLIFNNLQSQLI